MEHDIEVIKEDILRLVWYMRGSISYNDAMLLNAKERETIGKIIKSNWEVAQKVKMPFW